MNHTVRHLYFKTSLADGLIIRAVSEFFFNILLLSDIRLGVLHIRLRFRTKMILVKAYWILLLMVSSISASVRGGTQQTTSPMVCALTLAQDSVNASHFLTIFTILILRSFLIKVSLTNVSVTISIQIKSSFKWEDFWKLRLSSWS